MLSDYRKLQVFLCHASQDKPIVRELYKRLLSEIWVDAWLDEEQLLPGQDWDLEIEKAVEAADAVIICLSTNSVSKEGYVQRELRFVLDLADEKTEEAIFAIPLRLDDCIRPRRLRKWQYVDYFPNDHKELAVERILHALQNRQNQLRDHEHGKPAGLVSIAITQSPFDVSEEVKSVLGTAREERGRRASRDNEERLAPNSMVYLWGPSGTGKTWLVNAFIRTMNLIENALREADSPFDMWVEDRLGHRQVRYRLNGEPTGDIEYQEYILHRTCVSRGKRDLRAIACTHSHQFMTLDGPGDEVTGVLETDANTELNQARILASNVALSAADYLIVCVERGLSSALREATGDNSDFENSGRDYLERLRGLLAMRRNPRQQVIICFTKSDLYGGRAAGLDAALARLFGKYGPEIRDCFYDLGLDRRNIPPHFFVSSVGYHHNMEGKILPNLDRSKNELISPADWHPDGVEKPFFKVFTDADLRVLETLEINLPSVFGKVLHAYSVQKQRAEIISKYVTYDSVVNQLHVRV